MPERVTKEERIVSLAIEKARRAKELLQQESVHERLPIDEEIEVEKIKRPKVTNVKPKNQTQKKEGYGLAGEITEHKIKKAESNLPDDVKEALDKAHKQVMDALENTPKDLILSVLTPNQRQYISPEEFTKAMVKIAKKSLKDKL